MNIEQNNPLFQAIFDYSPIGIALLSETGILLKANTKLCNITGYLEKELLKNNFEALIHENDIDIYHKYVKKIAENKIQKCQLEQRIHHKKNKIILILLSISLVKNNKQSPYYIYQIQDITLKHHPKKIAENNVKTQKMSKDHSDPLAYLFQKENNIEFDEDNSILQAQEKNLTNSIESENNKDNFVTDHQSLEFPKIFFGVGYWLLDPDNNYLFWSKEVYGIHGVSQENYKPELKSAIDFYHPDDRDIVINSIKKAMKTKKPFEFQMRIVRPTGEIRYVAAKANIVNKNNKVCLFGIFQDTTDNTILFKKLKYTANELEETRNFHNLIKELNTDLIFVKDSEFKIVEANRAYLNTFPKKMQNEIIGHTGIEAYNKKEAEKFLEQDRLAFKKGYSEVIEDIQYPVNGKKHVLFTKKTCFKNSKGEKFILGIARDVTEREQLIEELKRSNKELDDFAYITSHDLKEPLRGIYNYSSFLIEDYKDKLDKDGKEKLYTLKKLSKRMEKLIDDLLHYSRLNKIKLEPKKVDLDKLIYDIKDNIKLTLEEKNITLHIPKKLPKINCKKILVNELFTNLIVNATKYNDKENKWIEVGLKKNSKDPYVFYVRDNGIGIKEKHFKEIFHIFKRLNGKEKFGEGSGFGLTIAEKIIKEHNGKIWLESRFGEGTIFYFTLDSNIVN